MPPLSTQLRSLNAVRQTTSLLLQSPQHLNHFDVHLDKLDAVVEGVLALIKRDYKTPQDIPFHSRWRHFDSATEKRIQKLVLDKADGVDPVEKVRRIIDLFVVSVLLDAGAGAQWTYKFSDGTVLGRSEGLALASLDWFLTGGFSDSPTPTPHRVDASALQKVSVQALEKAFQVSPANPLVGAAGRCSLLSRLGNVLLDPVNARFFYNKENGDYRPGNMVDYVLSKGVKNGDGKVGVSVTVLWEVVMDGLSGIWPATRTTVDGSSVGDVWPCKAVKAILKEANGGATVGEIPKLAEESGLYFVAFHKLSQWLTYSLMEPLSLLNCTFEHMDIMTGLAEYRNGGLFVDFEVITLKPETKARGLAASTAGSTVPRFEVFDDAVVEWRGLTVALLDLVGARVQKVLGMTKEELPLVKVLEAGTWKLGREIAAKLRPESKGPPIDIVSDGTVF
ncbi:UNVERIFIED_CONTAM: hypothetical protein HDU68_001163 [Siphonaria sp. JEL0065]|nr:hypothetical protein HDU68_001163 [Siphonaria sp. JEL0065]